MTIAEGVQDSKGDGESFNRRFYQQTKKESVMLFPGDSLCTVDRRLRQDRRKNGFWKQILGIKWFGQRRQLRRMEDRRKMVLLDHYPIPLLAAAFIVLVLSIGDAILTLILLSNGATELNPIMNYLLKIGTTHFILGKYILTACAVLIILIFSYYPLCRKIPVPSFFVIFALIFSAVIAWQVYLITRYVM